MQINKNFSQLMPSSVAYNDERKKFLLNKAIELISNGTDYALLTQELKILNERTCVPALKSHDVEQIAFQAFTKRRGGEQPIQLNYDWKNEPVSLAASAIEAPALSIDLVPERLRTWVADCAERMQTTPEAIMAPVLVSFSSLVGRKIGIYPKQYDDWLVVPNLWGALVSQSPNIADAVISEGMRPISRLDEQAPCIAQRRHSDEQCFCNEVAINSGRYGAGVAGRASREKGKRYSTYHQRYKSNDNDPESIAQLLTEGQNGLLVVDDDLCGFLQRISKEKYRRERRFYTESWTGDRSYTLRVKSCAVEIPYHLISIFGVMQRDALVAYLNKMDKYSLRDCGLLQRFQILINVKQKTEWKNVDNAPNLVARESVFDVFNKIASVPPPISRFVPAVRFTKAAQEAFDDWRKNLECRLRASDAQSLALKSHLMHYRTLMPSLALLLWILEGPENIHGWGSVSLSATNNAIKWCDFLEKHASAIYSARKNEQAMAAYRLANCIKEGNFMEGMPVKSLYRSQLPELASKPLVDAALKALEKRNWLRVARELDSNDAEQRVWLHPKFSRHHRNIFELPS